MPPKTRSKIAEEETPASKTAGKRRGRPSALARPHTEPPRRRKKRTKTANSSPKSPSTPLRGPRMVANRLSPSPPQQSRSSQRMRRMEEQLAILSNAVLAGMHNQQATQSAWHMTPSVSASPSLPRARCPPTLSPAWPPTNLPRCGTGEVRAAAETAPANFQRHPQDPIASTHSLTVTTTAPAQVPHTVGMAPLPPPDRLIADPMVAGQVMAALQTLNPAAPCTGDPSYDYLLEKAAHRQTTAHRPGTVGAHRRALSTFVAFSAHFNIDYTCPGVNHILAYIEYLAQHFKSPQSVKNSISSLSTAMKRAGRPLQVLSHFKVQLATRAIEINMRHVPTRKRPVTPKELDDITKSVWYNTRNISAVCAIAMAFTGFLRQSNLVAKSAAAFDPTRTMTRADVTKTGAVLNVTLKWSKTIQRTADAAHITLPSIKGRWFCPVATYSAMVQALPTTHQDQPLFVHKDGKPLTVRYLTKVWKDGVRTVGLDPQSISLHSLRKGGATAVYNSASAKDEDIKSHGTWTSSAWRIYAQRDPEKSSVVSALKKLSV